VPAAPTAGADAGSALLVQPIPLPGQQAIDFELPAVVGNDIKNIKLSDYNGKWRVLCFFPAAFTFV
jgi:alkyl hydroperoxide reductase subunit AhpC